MILFFWQQIRFKRIRGGMHMEDMLYTVQEVAAILKKIVIDNNITMNDVEDIARLKPNCVVFKEAGFKDDNEKMNATYTLERCKVEKILCI